MAGFKTVSLADQVFERLEDDIITGVYPRGEILTELKLVEVLGVSRTPIREALRRLEQERLIAESGKGSVVLGITQEDLMDIMDIRQRVEGLAAFHAAKRISPEGIEKLRSITNLQEFYFAKQDVEVYRNFSELGKGDVDFAAVMRILDEAQFDGYHCIELDKAPVSNIQSARNNLKYLENLVY